MAILAKKYILRLEIAIYEAFLMEIFDGQNDLSRIKHYLFFLKSAFLS